MDTKRMAEVNDLLEAKLPDNCIRPKPGYLPTREEENVGKLDFRKLNQGTYSCVIRHIRTAPREGGTAMEF